MPQSLSKVYLHLIFSTKNRKQLIDHEIESRLHEYLGGIAKGLECNPIQIGGDNDHVHILCLLSRKIAQMTLLEEIKKRSSKWIKTIDQRYAFFYWQDGYGAFSVSADAVNKVIAYIQNQKEHHKRVSFQDEFRAFLKEYGVEYDERYVWD
ncbi:IS200/IS605 family transposase [Roseimarinus sediminis]|uniref:IS200/IS605 family transposase n=1 Tax=Roseimarinus sediminis TaxID=1610899 RepID=UPI003D25324D